MKWEAMRFDGDPKNIRNLMNWGGERLSLMLGSKMPCIVVDTPDGVDYALASDLIIKNSNGDFYVCKLQ